jgi:2-polyprenyl-3-methyl-5-hydroxy-6-metoxy-1,4-benzoquinol methylase
MKSTEDFEWTGERLTTSKGEGEVVIHHLHRYAFTIDFIKDKTVLDIASGEGYGSYIMSKYAKKVLGVDIDEKVIQHSKNKYQSSNLNFKTGSVEKIPIESNSIDVVISFETIEHHDKHEEMLKEIKRVLKPDGVLIMSSPDKLNYSDIPRYQNPFHVKELYREEFKKFISSYFSKVKMYNQSIVFGSIITTENGVGKNFSEYEGDFKNISKHCGINTPVYNICVASDFEIIQFSESDFSFFNANKMLLQILSKEQEIYNSKTYKAGKLITFPLRLFRSIKCK